MCLISSVYPRGIIFPGSEYFWITTGENRRRTEIYILQGHDPEGLPLHAVADVKVALNPTATRENLVTELVTNWVGGGLTYGFWFSWTWLEDTKGKYDSWTRMMGDHSLQGIRGEGRTEKFSMSVFLSYEPSFCTGRKVLSLENEMGHEHHGFQLCSWLWCLLFPLV